MLTIYIWSTQKWPLRQSMCTHVAHTLNFSKNKKKVDILFSVVGTLCAVWVHILCPTIHFLAVLIWFFNVTKYQNRTTCQSRGWGAKGAKSDVISARLFSRVSYEYVMVIHINPVRSYLSSWVSHRSDLSGPSNTYYTHKLLWYQVITELMETAVCTPTRHVQVNLSKKSTFLNALFCPIH